MRSSIVRTMVFQSITKFLLGSRWIMGSLKFLTDKFGDLSLQEPEPCEVVESGTHRLPPAPVQVSLVNEAQLGHGLDSLGETDMEPTEDKADHTLAVLATAIDPICQPSSTSDFVYGREVYMVEQGGQPPEKLLKRSNRRLRKK
jgi:hypothetical protein